MSVQFVISGKYLGIQLIYVPAEAAGLLQPLDRRVFGVLKSYDGMNSENFNLN